LKAQVESVVIMLRTAGAIGPCYWPVAFDSI
jgi:hypothetical protein